MNHIHSLTTFKQFRVSQTVRRLVNNFTRWFSYCGLVILKSSISHELGTKTMGKSCEHWELPRAEVSLLKHPTVLDDTTIDVPNSHWLVDENLGGWLITPNYKRWMMMPIVYQGTWFVDGFSTVFCCPSLKNPGLGRENSRRNAEKIDWNKGIGVLDIFPFTSPLIYFDDEN